MASIGSVLPAVTTTVQSTYLTGAWPAEHGAVGNGWYFRDECEVKFWKQSNKLVQRPKVWDVGQGSSTRRSPAPTLFWWYAMYSSADYTVTPRPMYPADGLKLPGLLDPPGRSCATSCSGNWGRSRCSSSGGRRRAIKATQWIADAAIRVDRKYDPTLSLVYLPHLDYVLQRVGPDRPEGGRATCASWTASAGS